MGDFPIGENAVLERNLDIAIRGSNQIEAHENRKNKDPCEKRKTLTAFISYLLSLSKGSRSDSKAVVTDTESLSARATRACRMTSTNDER